MWSKNSPFRIFDGQGAYTVYSTQDEASQLTCGDNCADVYGYLYNYYAVEP